MELTIWRFNATRKSFDGARVLLEAKAAGLGIFRLNFPEGSQLWVSEEYYSRASFAGLKGLDVVDNQNPEVTKYWGDSRVGVAYGESMGYYLVTRIPDSLGGKMYIPQEFTLCF